MVDRRITKSAQYDNNTLFSLGFGCLITEAWSALNRVCDTHFHLDLRFLCSCRDGLCCLCGLYRVLPTRCHAIHNYQSLSLWLCRKSRRRRPSYRMLFNFFACFQTVVLLVDSQTDSLWVYFVTLFDLMWLHFLLSFSCTTCHCRTLWMPFAFFVAAAVWQSVSRCHGCVPVSFPSHFWCAAEIVKF